MQTVNWAGQSYNIPNQRGDTPWSGLSDFAIAVAAKGINTNGGAFTLLADLNFGATFGVVSTYFKSRTANIATAGILRLASADTIQWRNNANGGNVSLSKNSSDELLWNGSRIILAGGGLIVNADISASAAIAFSKLAALTSGNIIVGSAGTVPTSVAVSGDATLVASGALTLATVNSNVGSFTAANITVNAKGLITAAASGSAGVSSVSGTANQITSTGGTTPVLALASPLTTPGAITVSGNLTFSPTTAGIVGTTTNNNTAAGNVGEYVESLSAANVNAAATGVYDDLTSISLTAGDWDISVIVTYENNGATWTGTGFGIGTVTGNNATGLITGQSVSYNFWASSSTTPTQLTSTVPPYRKSLSGTTTIYLKRFFTYSAGTPRTVGGRISARRVR